MSGRRPVDDGCDASWRFKVIKLVASTINLRAENADLIGEITLLGGGRWEIGAQASSSQLNFCREIFLHRP